MSECVVKLLYIHVQTVEKLARLRFTISVCLLASLCQLISQSALEYDVENLKAD